jgi:hypothetical protein
VSYFSGIKVVARSHFACLYTQQEEVDPSSTDYMLEHIPPIISDEDNRILTQPIVEAEIFFAIWSLGMDKALGLDDFSISFYRHFWNLIRYDLKRMLQYTHHSLRIGGNTNSSFIALVPKESNPSTFARFWPISLCNSSYKILTKIIASQLKNFYQRLSLPIKEDLCRTRKLWITLSWFRKPFTPM